MSQTDEIHESFYDLFNQRFLRVDNKEGPRFFTNIAIGPHSRPCRVNPEFQCIIVVKKSEVERTPAPFLNRFEKYCISYTGLTEALLPNLSSLSQIILQIAMCKVRVW